MKHKTGDIWYLKTKLTQVYTGLDWELPDELHFIEYQYSDSAFKQVFRDGSYPGRIWYNPLLEYYFNPREEFNKDLEALINEEK